MMIDETLTPMTFYRELTMRNRGFISDSEQSALAEATVLIAGCGSTGGAVVEPLIRLGVRSLIVADPGTYELSNLNRQEATVDDLGANKAEVAAQRARAINPYSSVQVETAGLCEGNVSRLVGAATVVIDGVDVTEQQGLAAKYLLHAEAACLGKPVISGYDMAGMQYIRFYDYRRQRVPFDGRITDTDVAGSGGPLAVLAKLIPLRHVPTEMLENLRDNLGDPQYSIPQLAYAASLFGALASRMVVEVIAGGRVRQETVVDIHSLVRTPGARAAGVVRRIKVLGQILPKFLRVRVFGSPAGAARDDDGMVPKVRYV